MAWVILVSHKMQEDARKRAMKLKAEIIKAQHTLENCQIMDDTADKKIKIISVEDGSVKFQFSYKLSRFKLFFINNYRKFFYLYYAGGGEEAKRLYSVRFNITYYLAAKYDWGMWLHDGLNHYSGVFRSKLNKIKSIFQSP